MAAHHARRISFLTCRSVSMHSNWCSSTAGSRSSNRQSNRAVDTVLYGLNGRVVRVALPRLVPQKTHVAGRYGESHSGQW